MSFLVALTQNGSVYTTLESGIVVYNDSLILKAESEAETQSRSPIIIALPGGTLFGLDLGRNVPIISITGILDTINSELFVTDNSKFDIGQTIYGQDNATYCASMNPARSKDYNDILGPPSCTILAKLDTTTYIVSGMQASRYFCYGERVYNSEYSEFTYAVAQFPTMYRLKQAAQYWYLNGVLELVTSSGTHYGYIKNVQYAMDAGKEDRYSFKLDFAVSVKDA